MIALKLAIHEPQPFNLRHRPFEKDRPYDWQNVSTIEDENNRLVMYAHISLEYVYVFSVIFCPYYVNTRPALRLN